MAKPPTEAEKHFDRYLRACHAVQSGVASFMAYKPEETNPKHLRVGINVALRDLSSTVELLVAKGVITREEHMKALADGMEEEVKQYERELSAHYGGQEIVLK